MKFYTKNDQDEYVEATQDQFEDFFKTRIERLRQTERDKVKAELEQSVRSELEPKLKDELTKSITEAVEGEFKPKLEEAESKLAKVDVQLRQKTIAAEYGFKADLESFLGDGTEEEMRGKADLLKKNALITDADPAPNKSTSDSAPTEGFVTEVG